jgi:hypothetical protein
MIAMISKVSDSINRLEYALMKCGVSARDDFPKWARRGPAGFRENNYRFHIPKTWWTLIRNDRPKLALSQSWAPLTSQFHQNYCRVNGNRQLFFNKREDFWGSSYPILLNSALG